MEKVTFSTALASTSLEVTIDQEHELTLAIKTSEPDGNYKKRFVYLPSNRAEELRDHLNEILGAPK